MIDGSITTCMPNYVLAKQGAKIYMGDVELFPADGNIIHHFPRFPYINANILVGNWSSEYPQEYKFMKTT